MKAWVKTALVALSLGVLYWPGIKYQWEASTDPYFAPYDAVQYIPAFFKYDVRDPIPTSYAKEYYLNVLSPPLYKLLTRTGAQVADVRRFQLATMYLAYAVFLVVLGRLAWELGGATLSFAVLALTITSWIFMGLGFIGGAPRMYGYPLVSLILYALIRDRPYLLAVTTVLGGLLYPVVAIIGGACLLVWMCVPSTSGRGVVSCWGLSRRLMTVTLTGFLTLAALAPLLAGGQLYGRRILVSDIANFPEAGPDGNYRPYDQLPYKLFGIELFTYFVGPLYSHGDPVLPWLNVHRQLDDVSLLFVLAVGGIIILLVILRGVKTILQEDQQGGAIRLVAFFCVCGILHVLAWLAAPYAYIPTRYFMFSLPFLIALVFPWSLYSLLKRDSRLHSLPKLHTVFLGIITMYLVLFGGRGNVPFSASFVEKGARPVFEAIAGLPHDAVIAGWPLGQLRKVEYVTRRNVFLTGDLHQVLHVDFIKTMRERMDAMFDAYFSIDGAPLYRLRQQFGVTHLLVEEQDFKDSKHPPEYFEPWKSRIQPRLTEIKGREYLLNESLRRHTAVFSQNGFVLLDLKRLP